MREVPEEKQFLPCDEAIYRVTGIRFRRTSIHRWVHEDVYDTRLKTYVIGRNRYTTIQDVRRWIQERTDATTTKPRTSSARSRRNHDERIAKQLERELA